MNSQESGLSSDIFGFLYMKTVGSKSSSTKFEAFIYGIFVFNILILIYGIDCIIFLNTYKNKSLNLLNLIESYGRMASRVYKGTSFF